VPFGIVVAFVFVVSGRRFARTTQRTPKATCRHRVVEDMYTPSVPEKFRFSFRKPLRAFAC
jgi:hypothetical protein